MQHVAQALVNDIHNEVLSLQIGAPIQRLGKRLGFEKCGEQSQMSLMVLRLDLRTGSGSLEGRHGVVDLAE